MLDIEKIKCPMNVRSILEVKGFVVTPFRGLGPNPLGALARTIGAHAVHSQSVSDSIQPDAQRARILQPPEPSIRG